MTDLSPAAPHVPETLRTPRLLLRAPRPDDAQAQVEAINASHPELRRWMAWAQQTQTLEQAAENLTQAQVAYREGRILRLMIWNSEGTQLIGSSGFHALDWRIPKGEIGYWIATPHTGQGYAQEVTRALTEFGLRAQSEGGLGLRRLEIRCDDRNERSARIPRLLGYKLDATLIHDDVAAHDPTMLRNTLLFSRVQ